jgi:hypothetical protein
MIFIQWNEVNFPLLEKYANKYDLKNIKKVLNFNQTITHSETQYILLEPWIQWASVNTALPFSEHKIFRLGDAVYSENNQIFEGIEEKGYKVGAISPMNVVNKLKNPSYFIPDPWTDTPSDQTRSSKQLTEVLRQTVNDNASGKISFKNYFYLLINFLRFCSIRLLPTYISLILRSRKRKWCKALFLDLLLSDVHKRKYAKAKPHFSTLFLNGFAHIQHHYFLNSEFCNSNTEMPDWYISEKSDALLDAVLVYEKIIGSILQSAEKKPIIFATGLSQEPYENPVYYYRLKNHKNFIQLLGFKNFKIKPRMTRDFSISFEGNQETLKCADILKRLMLNGKELFSVDVRDRSLFVTLEYKNEIHAQDKIVSVNGEINLGEHVIFVALKNGHHCETGYVAWSNLPDQFLPPELSHVSILGDKIDKYFPYSATK